jgi:hypothetical protein
MVTQFLGENKIRNILPEYCLHDVKQGTFQLSHEAILCIGHHCQHSIPVTRLEESMATFFSIKYYNAPEYMVPANGYGTAYQLFDELYSKNRNLIKEIRKTKATISFITVDDILNINSNIPSKLAEEITEPFEL